jgi:Ni/Co efflux regulator RcnB
MKPRKWICFMVAMVVALAAVSVFAQGQGKGREEKQERKEARKSVKKEKRKEKHKGYYSTRDREWMHSWYREHHGHLPPGLAKRDELPPGLARELRVHGTLPPGLQRDIHPVPEEFVRRLPPPPPDCEHVLIGGNIVLLNRKTHLVLDIFALFR